MNEEFISLTDEETDDGDIQEQGGCHCCRIDGRKLKEEFGYCRNPVQKDREFGRWVDETTVHGVVHVFKGTSIFRRILWTAIFIGAFTGFTYNSIDRLLFLLRGTSQSSVSFTSSPEGVAFPAVTLCNLEQFSQDYAEKENLTDFIDFLFTFFPEDEELGCSEAVDEVSMVADVSKTLHDLYQEGGPQAAAFFIYCSFGADVFDCSELFVPAVTQTGLCYTFNGNLSQPGLLVNNTGQRYGLRVILNITSSDLLPNYIGDQGVKVAIHPRGVPPEPDETGVAVPPGRNAFISLQARSFSDESSKSQCSSSDLPFFTNSEYSLPACRQNRFLSAVHEQCSCLDSLTGVYRNISAEYADAPDCTIADTCCVFEQYFMLDFNSCPADCYYDSFESSISYSKFPSTHIATELASFLMTNPNELDNDLVSLNVYFEDLFTQVMEVSDSYSIIAFLSDLGGQMGLFLGASVISAIEIGMFIGDEIWACLFSKKWKRKNRLKPKKVQKTKDGQADKEASGTGEKEDKV